MDKNKAKATSKAVVPVVSGTVIVPGEDRLVAIADEIRSEWGKGIEAQFAIGRLLMEAWDQFGGDKVAYGRWSQEQNFPFHRNTGLNLRLAAEREPEVRAYLAEVNAPEGGQRDIGVNSAMKELLYGPRPSQAKPAPTFTMDEVSENHRTDSVFTRWQFATYNILGRNVSDDDEATVTWADRPFEHLHVDDLVEAADLIKRLVTAYQTEKTARAASA